jgi:ice-binding like protein
MKNMRLSLLSFSLAVIVILIWPATGLAATDPGLATAAPFGVLAGTTVTNTGNTTIAGQLGLAPGSAVVGFPPGTSGAQHIGDAVATTAKTDLTAAYVNAAAQPCPAVNDRTGVNLGGQTLVPGVYCQTTAPTLTGTLTLNGSGIYIFQIGSTLITAPSAVVALIGGAQPCQVFWQVSSSATLDTTTTFVGTIMALTDISMNNGVTLTGRALARNGQVSLINDTILQPAACLAVAPSPSPVASPVATPTTGVGLPATGVPPDLRGEFPWLLLIGGTGALGAIALGVSSARRRRRKT